MVFPERKTVTFHIRETIKSCCVATVFTKSRDGTEWYSKFRETNNNNGKERNDSEIVIIIEEQIQNHSQVLFNVEVYCIKERNE